MAVNGNKNYITYGLIGLLVVAAFLIGTLYTKVNYLEKGGGTNTLGTQAGNNGQQPQAPIPTGGKVNVQVTDKDPSQGPSDAKVTVVEFADYQCPFCGAFSGLSPQDVQSMQARDSTWQPAEPNIVKDYVNSGKVRFVWKDYPFLGQESTWAGEAAKCAQDQGKFWEYHDYLYSHQGQENSGAFSKDNLKKFAATLGLNTTDFNNCLDSDKYAKAMQDAVAYGQSVGVNGTPATFVNGVLISGAAPYSQFKTAIDAALK